VESTKDEGSTFTVRVPAHFGMTADGAQAAPDTIGQPEPGA
jgi:hypothetical protein